MGIVWWIAEVELEWNFSCWFYLATGFFGFGAVYSATLQMEAHEKIIDDQDSEEK